MINKNKKFSFLAGMLLILSMALSAYGMSEKQDINQNDQKKEVFQDRIVYFDRAINEDDNFALLKKVIIKAKRLGFNALVLNEEYVYARLSHQNPVIDMVKERLSEVEKLAHKQGLKVIVMHFNPEVPTLVAKDGDEANHFYQKGAFDFSEANKAVTAYKVVGDYAYPDTKVQKAEKSLLDGLYHFKDIKPNTEYKLTMTASTHGYSGKVVKVSVLDEDHKGENGKVLFGIQKFYRDITPTQRFGQYSIYFNSLNHKNTQGKIKVFLYHDREKGDLNINAMQLQEVGYTKEEQVVRKGNKPVVASDFVVYEEGKDYQLHDSKLDLLSARIKKEHTLQVSWYPRIDVSRFYDHDTTADSCADTKLYYAIMKDQLAYIKSAMHGRIDGIAFNDDEWREAGWDERCKDVYAKEYDAHNTIGGFTGGDYIGITTRKLIENLVGDSNLTTYVMSDMFDPNFNAKDPYMGVKDGAKGAIDYLPKETVVFNWFPNPYEPGLEDKRSEDFSKSVKFFSDHGILQIIAGYHDDIRNLDANIAVYKNADIKTRKSIIGFMFLIWNQPGKHPSYDDMDKVVGQICQQLPGKWPAAACKVYK